MARRAHAARVPYDDDGSEQYRAFRRAISNVLSTELALSTFAQIVDGLPTADIAFDRHMHGLDSDHPVDKHEELCPGVMERTREIRDQFDPSILVFDPVLIKAYRRAMPGSRVFKVLLLELVAVFVHQLAVLLFNLNICMHTGGPEEVKRVTQYEEPPLAPGLAAFTPEATIFNHHAYLHDDIYPDGPADMAGHWAEDRVLGGVTVFDRPAAERSPDDPPNAWFNSSRRKVIFGYYQLLDHQQDALVDFFLAEDPTSTNTVRLDFWDAILHRFVCRDPWECKPLRPQNTLDYPEYQAVRDAVLARFGDGAGSGGFPTPRERIARAYGPGNGTV
ncbi:hypothetical protein C8A05DRAFT_48308 [Staphylotrichum tortipilum]|uniref:Uncharacterized protein n=1 Tax=Staphylotrichum tortipilum TaxID=2831512 RepID=A0AAN6MAF8_9PEZI|nr:hypothetical protein C8A05DRAFT_48308 [Staphylotrichum longicolle]